MLVHYVTKIEEPYKFTICIDYSKSLFDLSKFLLSLENTENKRFMKDIEILVDKNEWMNKEGILLAWSQKLGTQ